MEKAFKTIHRTGNGTSRVAADGTAQLRVLATTDLHMQFMGFDYVNDSATARKGLAGIATLIHSARAEAEAQNRGCLLLDNGDLLQGSAMGHRLAQLPVQADHPAAAILNGLGYDALGVGNHDLDFGMPYLRDVAARLEAPVIASNLIGDNLAPLQKSAVISCTLPGSGDADDAVIRIGLLSVLPMQTAIWNSDRLKGHAQIELAADSLRSTIPELRAQGADLIIVLAHMGITSEGLEGDAITSETALALAKLPGIDAMITGHTHRRFPGHDHAQGAGVHPARGTLSEVPAVMPGHGGSDLGVLDLTLRRNGAGQWQVISHVSGLRPNTSETPANPAIITAATPAHDALRRHLSVHIGTTSEDLHTCLSLVAPSSVGALSARACWLSVQRDLAGTPDAALPLLVAAPAHTSGGREGPDHYLRIPAGPVLRRHIAGLNPFSNQVWVVRITGAELLRRLEHAATVFARLRAGREPALLLRGETPAFNFETIYGVEYRIDPRQPAGSRISGLTREGAAVLPDDTMLLITDQFRAAGGGGFECIEDDRVVLRRKDTDEAAIAAALAGNAPSQWRNTAPWTFANCGGLPAELATSPLAEHYLHEIAHMSPKIMGYDCSGFLRLKLTL